MRTIVNCFQITIVICLLFVSNVNGQNVLDGIYIKEHTPARKPIPYTHLREADVMWNKRIWRKIDLREKMNHPFYFPTNAIGDRRNLITVIRDAVLEGTITAYSSEDDRFLKPMTKMEVEAIGAGIDTIYIENDETGEQEMKIQKKEFNPDDIKEFRIKEDWFFDKQKSVMEVRIIGICPVKEKIDMSTGESKGSEPMFWIYFPEARNVFANSEVFNRQNDSERRTYEDIFWKREFSSYISKESNVYDRSIKDYVLNLDALLEAERIKESIFFVEHDLWEF